MNNSISFNGNITVTTWKNAVESFDRYPTKQNQDKLLRYVAHNITEFNEVKTINAKNFNHIRKFIESVIDRELPNTKLEKSVYYNGKDNLVIADKDAILLDGMRIDIDI